MKGLLFTYALVAIGVLGAFWRPSIGLLVYIAFAVLRPQYLWGWAADMGGLSLIVGSAMLFSWIVRGAGAGHWKLRVGRASVLALLFYLGWMALSWLQARNETVATAALLNLLKIVLPFLVGLTMLRGERDARAVLWIVVIAQGYIGWEMNLAYLRGFNRARDIGFGGLDNNSFAVGLVATMGPALALALSSRTLYARGAAAVAAALIMHTILLTFSRGAVLGMAGVFGIGILILPKRARYLLPVAAAALLAIRLTGPELLARFTTSFAAETQRDYSAESRVALWTDCLMVAEDHPIFGVGPDNWRSIAADYGWPSGKSAHSVWMETLAELGFIGVGALLLFYAITVRLLWPIARNRDPARADAALLATGFIMSIAGFVVTAQFVSVKGLELPFYVTMAALVFLNDPAIVPRAAPETAAAAVLPRTTRSVALRPVRE